MGSILIRIIARSGLARQDVHATSLRRLTGYPITILAGLLRTEMLETLPFLLLNTAWAVAYIQTMEVCSFFYSPSWYVLLAVEAASITHPVALGCRVRLQFTIVLSTVQRLFCSKASKSKGNRCESKVPENYSPRSAFTVKLPNGKVAEVALPLTATVGDLVHTLVRNGDISSASPTQGWGILSNGVNLQYSATLGDCGIQDGTVLSVGSSHAPANPISDSKTEEFHTDEPQLSKLHGLSLEVAKLEAQASESNLEPKAASLIDVLLTVLLKKIDGVDTCGKANLREVSLFIFSPWPCRKA